jgi:hypothetical protein
VPLRRILVLVFAVTAAVAVLSALTGFTGRLPDASGVLALLTVALYSALYVAQPVPRWTLTAAAVLAAASVVTQLHTDPIPAGFSEITTFHEQAAEGQYAEAVLLAIAVAALTVGMVALPQFRRPVRLTAAACVVALVSVAVVAMDAADERDLLAPAADQGALFRHVAPGMLATVLGGLLLVLAVSRADRRFLAPAGALLVQLAAAHAAWSMSGSWYLTESLRGVETSSAFLEPGLRTDVSATATASVVVDFEVGAALALAALLVGPALIAAGAARTAGARSAVGGPA